MIKYADITYPDVNNGDGCRLTLWISGCEHFCKNCHNSWLADYDYGSDLTLETANAIIDIFNKHPYLKGITLSGGDPLCQYEKDLIFVLEKFIPHIKEKVNREIDVWVYTGFIYEQLPSYLRTLLKNNCNVLVDGKYKESERNIMLPFRGSSNQRIIDLKKTTESQIVEIPDETFQK